MIEIKLTSEELAELKSTINARLVRLTEWIGEAKKNNNEKDLALWSEIKARREKLLWNISAQAKAKDKA